MAQAIKCINALKITVVNARKKVILNTYIKKISVLHATANGVRQKH